MTLRKPPMPRRLFEVGFGSHAVARPLPAASR